MSLLERLSQDIASADSVDCYSRLDAKEAKAILAAVEAANLLELRANRIVELLKALDHPGEAARLEKARIAYSDAAAQLEVGDWAYRSGQ